MQEFFCKTRVVVGDAAQALCSLESKSLLLVTDPYFLENGLARKLAVASKASRTRIFADVIPDPSVELAAKGTQVAKEFMPDTIVALGGGSAMDCAKAIAFFYKQPITLVAIPTTSGSGSEVTDFAVLTCGDTKYPLVDPQVCPHVAILDDNLLKGLPKSLVADAGFDVLAHALEGFVATKAGEISKALAKEAFSLAFAYLPASYAGNTSVRGKIHLAATMAGISFSNGGLGLCHAISHSLGGQFHIPHGRLNAVLLPAVVSCNALSVADQYAKIARAAGIGGSADTVAVRSLRNGLVRLRRELGLPETLAQTGISPKTLRQKMGSIVEAVLRDPCCQTNPIPVEDFMVLRVLEEVMGHG